MFTHLETSILCYLLLHKSGEADVLNIALEAQVSVELGVTFFKRVTRWRENLV